MTFLYQRYLSHYKASVFEVDGFTKLVAEQTQKLMLFLNLDVSVLPNPTESSIKLYYNQKYMVRIIEGCNALNVIILFVSFVIAFTGKWGHTILFLIFGTALIHIMNIFRIALLTVVLYHFPAQGAIFHDIIFPLIIYGFVFILWIIWVRKFSKYAT